MPTAAGRTDPTDDEILDWWEMYTDNWPITYIARRYDRPAAEVRRHLEELGVYDAPEQPSFLWDNLSDEDKKVALALARLDPDAVAHPRHLPFARSLPHVKPNVHKRVPMSGRQRANDALGGGLWAKAVRADLRRAGLLP
jgi:hypothetical protein